jgi:hypothetical protein
MATGWMPECTADTVRQSAMIRVTKTDEPSRTTVTVDGELSIESVCVVETCCQQAESAGKPVQVFLRDVTTVDPAGRMLLGRLSARGVRLAAAGLYTSYVVQTLTSLRNEHRAGDLAILQRPHGSPHRAYERSRRARRGSFVQ